MPTDSIADQPQFKRCSKGDKCIHPDGPLLPATPEYFYRDKMGRNGLNSRCKYCHKKRQVDWEAKNPGRRLQYSRNHYARNPERGREATKSWAKRHKDEVEQYNKEYYYKNLDKERARSRDYRNEHRDEINARQRENRDLDKDRIKSQKRRAKKRNLPNDFTTTDWQRCLDYFDGCCAYCGQSAGLWHVIAADHFVPLIAPDCPGTVPTNIVPACHAKKGGRGGCNNKKNDKDTKEWLIEQYGARKANKILKRIYDYFKCVSKGVT